jgi:hemoglobin
MNLWFETIDELFEGEYALKAKQKARKMSTFLYLNIFQSRQQGL